VRVTSPVGDFPFEPRKLRVEDGGLVMEGAMGAWPATVRVEPEDLPAILRLIPLPVLMLLGVVAAGSFMKLIGCVGGRRSNRTG
jgi:hypothetical protein